jgi:hypothetical protein
MRQISLGINQSCSNRLRVQIVPQLYKYYFVCNCRFLSVWLFLVTSFPCSRSRKRRLTETVFLNFIRSSGIDSASLCSLAGWHNNPITVKRPKFDILFGENIFFFKIFLGDPPLNFLEVCLKFRPMER